MTDETSTFPSPPVVFLSSASAWSGSAASSCLDTAMSFAVFDVPVVLVLHGAGVLQLLPEQNGDALQLKTLARTWGALSLYGIHEVLVEAESLQGYGYAPDELLCSASRIAEQEDSDEPLRLRSVATTELAAIIAASKAVFTF